LLARQGAAIDFISKDFEEDNDERVKRGQERSEESSWWRQAQQTLGNFHNLELRVPGFNPCEMLQNVLATLLSPLGGHHPRIHEIRDVIVELDEDNLVSAIPHFR
jgi:hypothetical protein